MLIFRAGRDEEVGLLVAGLDSGLLLVTESVGLLGLAVDFEGGGADLVDAADDVGLLFSDADLLVAETSLLVPCAVLRGALVGLLGFGMGLLEMAEVGLLDPGTVDAEPEPDDDDDVEELDADGTSSEMVFSTLSSFTGTSITA